MRKYYEKSQFKFEFSVKYPLDLFVYAILNSLLKEIDGLENFVTFHELTQKMSKFHLGKSELVSYIIAVKHEKTADEKTTDAEKSAHKKTFEAIKSTIFNILNLVDSGLDAKQQCDITTYFREIATVNCKNKGVDIPFEFNHRNFSNILKRIFERQEKQASQKHTTTKMLGTRMSVVNRSFESAKVYSEIIEEINLTVSLKELISLAYQIKFNIEHSHSGLFKAEDNKKLAALEKAIKLFWDCNPDLNSDSTSGSLFAFRDESSVTSPKKNSVELAKAFVNKHKAAIEKPLACFIPKDDWVVVDCYRDGDTANLKKSYVFNFNPSSLLSIMICQQLRTLLTQDKALKSQVSVSEMRLVVNLQGLTEPQEKTILSKAYEIFSPYMPASVMQVYPEVKTFMTGVNETDSLCPIILDFVPEPEAIDYVALDYMALRERLSKIFKLPADSLSCIKNPANTGRFTSTAEGLIQDDLKTGLIEALYIAETKKVVIKEGKRDATPEEKLHRLKVFMCQLVNHMAKSKSDLFDDQYETAVKAHQLLMKCFINKRYSGYHFASKKIFNPIAFQQFLYDNQKEIDAPRDFLVTSSALPPCKNRPSRSRSALKPSESHSFLRERRNSANGDRNPLPNYRLRPSRSVRSLELPNDTESKTPEKSNSSPAANGS